MANWKITLPSGKTYEKAEIALGVYSVVAELLNEKVKNWDDLEPYMGPNQLVAWIAVLSADESDVKDVQFHLQNAMTMPMAAAIRLIDTSE